MTALAYAPTGVDFDALKDKSYERTGLGAPLADHLASKRRLAGGTLYDRERYVASLARMYPSKGPNDFTSFDLMHWEAAQNVSTETLKTRRSHVNDFFNWCVKWDLAEKNPMARLEDLPQPTKKVFDIFTDAEVERLCALPMPDGPLMAIMLFGGLRKTECCRLQPRHVIGEPPPGQLSILKSKGGKDRLVPMSQRLSRAVAELTLVEGIAPSEFFWYTRRNQGRTIHRKTQAGSTSFHHWYGKMLDRADVRYRNPHMTRHTFATRWLRKGRRLETLSLVMGHSSIRVTFDLYAHLDMTDILVDMELAAD